MRLDQALVDRGLCSGRDQAKRLILAGQVRVNGQIGRKASDAVGDTDQVELAAQERFVSRGGHKLEAALNEFGISVDGLVAVDLGASTGGFTDCLLQRGARRVYAVDVGHGQLAWSLRQDERVVVMERCNARHLTGGDFDEAFGEGAHVVVVDCSFISLTKILPAASGLLRDRGRIVALIKPQFEAGRRDADRGRGVIRDPKVHDRVIAGLQGFVQDQSDLRWVDVIESPVVGPAGNKEFLAYLERRTERDSSRGIRGESGETGRQAPGGAGVDVGP